MTPPCLASPWPALPRPASPCLTFPLPPVTWPAPHQQHTTPCHARPPHTPVTADSALIPYCFTSYHMSSLGKAHSTTPHTPPYQKCLYQHITKAPYSTPLLARHQVIAPYVRHKAFPHTSVNNNVASHHTSYIFYINPPRHTTLFFFYYSFKLIYIGTVHNSHFPTPRHSSNFSTLHRA